MNSPSQLLLLPQRLAIVKGGAPEDVYYGMMKMTSVIPGVSVTCEYRIGDQYAHFLVTQLGNIS